MKILITGSNGFIGRNVKEYLEKKNMDIYCPKRGELNLLDFDAINKYLLKKKFDVVIHCGVTLLSIEENLKMFFNFEKLSDCYERLICIGSGAEFDSRNYVPRMNEKYFGKHTPSMTDIYGYSKYVIAKSIEEKKRNIFNLRVFGIFGKYEDYRRRFISNNICRLLCGMNILINQNALFDYIYIEDFNKILEMFLNNKPKYRTYNICTGQIVDFITLAKIINKIDGRNKNIEVKKEEIKTEYSGDNNLLLSEFKNIKFTNLENSIADLYNWYKYNSKLIFNNNLFKTWIKN